MHPSFPLSQTEIRDFVERALGEDLGLDGDITSNAVIPAGRKFTAIMCARDAMIICGLPLAVALFRALDPALQTELSVQDGDVVRAGQVLMKISGPARAILSAERPALNIIQHLSGIATRTRDYVRAVEGTKAIVLDTRKTIPGYRQLAKYATRCGGAQNHRIGLFDAILIKDNHIAVAGGIAQAILAAKNAGHQAIEVECDTITQVIEALDAGATRLLLDNMTLNDLGTAVNITGGRVPLEASGGVTLDTIAAIAQSGVDYISVGTALTLSAPAIDVGLDYAQR